MISFKNINQEVPYLIFDKFYSKALDAGQKNIEACCIASYSKDLGVNARFVNIKYIINKDFIFFTNYNSPKSKEFIFLDQITAVIYWNSTNTQIRLKSRIKKVENSFNDKYFKLRDKKKNALAISSDQSIEINSYDDIKRNFLYTLDNDSLNIRPDYWGGFSFKPYYFEFWTGHKSRLNKREVYKEVDNDWVKTILQP